jgi:cyclopropane-fatty-acyl-phospholipid synthase
MDKKKYRRVVEGMLSEIGVSINGPQPWDICVRDERMFCRVLSDKSLGLGESYMEGWWDCPRIDELIYRILCADLGSKIRGNLSLLVPVVQAWVSNRQSKVRAHDVARAHYNLDNDLFCSFLDPYNQYSCGYFNGTHDLAKAQLRKMHLICRKLELKPGEKLLDIGSGWGGLARFAAEHYGCSVTGINISQEQIRFAREFCEGFPVDICEMDYRDVTGTYDKIVSVGMFEHVGYKNYRQFLETAHRCLKIDGIFLLHTIGSNESTISTDPWIGKYIFPNGMLPSLSQIMKAAEGLFVIEDLHNLGPHYDTTLVAWNENFQKSRSRFEEKYGERFVRMWEYYLLSCAGAFRARYNQLWQLVMTKPGVSQPACRIERLLPETACGPMA